MGQKRHLRKEKIGSSQEFVGEKVVPGCQGGRMAIPFLRFHGSRVGLFNDLSAVAIAKTDDGAEGSFLDGDWLKPGTSLWRNGGLDGRLFPDPFSRIGV